MNKQRIALALQVIIPLAIILVVVILYPLSNSRSAEVGKKKYIKHCANCHGENGEGLRKLIPPLGDPKHLMLENLACIIRYGQSGAIQVFNKKYDGAMPGNYQLENDEITSIINYLYSAYPDSSLPSMVTLKQVNDVLERCSSAHPLR